MTRLMLIALMVVSFPIVARASVPPLLNYQGVLRDAVGDVVPDGNYSVTFRIWDAQSGGTSLWEESQSVVTHAGLFTALLGVDTPVPDSAFLSPGFLSTQVGADPEMSPRTQLSSVPYAFSSANAENAARVGGFSVSDLVPPALWSNAFRAYVFVPAVSGEVVAFTVASGKTRYITGIFCTGYSATITIDGEAVLAFGDQTGASNFWSSGGGAPIVVSSGQTVSISSNVNSWVLITGYEF